MIRKTRIQCASMFFAVIAVILTVGGCNGQGNPPPKTLTSLQITPSNQAVAVGNPDDNGRNVSRLGGSGSVGNVRIRSKPKLQQHFDLHHRRK